LRKGSRLPKPEEVVTLASLYGRKVNEIVRAGEPLADLQPHLRAVAQEMNADDAEVGQAISALQRFAEDYNRLERILNVSLRLNYPEEVKLGARVDVVSLAEDEAIKERQRLGLGDQPVIHLRNLLEIEVGLRIIYEDLPFSHRRNVRLFARLRWFGGDQPEAPA